MTARVLPPAEWWKLEGTDLASLWPKLDQETAQVIVVEKDGEILAHHALLPVLHAECLWVRPNVRGVAPVARRLWATVQHEARARGVKSVWTSADDPNVRRLIEHLDAKRVPGDHYLISLGGA